MAKDRQKMREKILQVKIIENKAVNCHEYSENTLKTFVHFLCICVDFS